MNAGGMKGALLCLVFAAAAVLISESLIAAFGSVEKHGLWTVVAGYGAFFLAAIVINILRRKQGEPK
jgi:hypothetical protein